MSNTDMNKKSTEELKKEHRRLQERLEELKDEIEDYTSLEGGSRQTQEGAQEIIKDIEREMDQIRERQRKIHKEVIRRKRSRTS